MSVDLGKRLVALFSPSLLLLAAAAVLLGAPLAAAADCPDGLDEVTVQLQWVLQPQFSGYVAAQSRRFFEDNCLRVTVAPGGIGVNADRNVRNGDAQFAARWTGEAIVARDTFEQSGGADGTDYVTIAQFYQRSGLIGVSLADSGIETVADYRGKSVGFWDCCSAEVAAAMRAESIAEDEVDYRPMGFVATPVITGEFDVVSAMTYNEYAQLLETRKEGTDTLYQREDFNTISYETSMLQDGLVVSKSWLEASPANYDITLRFVKATLLGWAYCRDFPEECVDMFYSGSIQGGPHATFMQAEVNKLVWPAQGGVGLMNAGDFDRTLGLLRAYSGVSDTLDANDFYTNEFVTAAVTSLLLEDSTLDLSGASFEPVDHVFCFDAQSETFHICTGNEDDENVRIVKDSNSTVLIIVVTASAVVFGILVVLAFVMYRRANVANRNWLIDLKELEVGEEIGRGGFAVVYRGKFRDTEVAIKKLLFVGSIGATPGATEMSHTSYKRATVLPSHSSNLDLERGTAWTDENKSDKLRLTGKGALYSDTSKSSVQRRVREFEAEVSVISGLRHESVLFLYGAAVEPGVAGYIVTEFMANGTVYDLLHNISASVPWRRRVEMALNMCSGMAYLHSRDVLHRDIKSTNLLLDRNLNVKVADFSIAGTSFTRHIGTLPWSAPELLRGEANTKASDVWAAGIVLWELATRRDPYEDLTSTEIRQKVAHENYKVDLTAIHDGPTDFRSIVSRTLAAQPDSRPSFTELVDLLGELLKDPTIDNDSAESRGSGQSELVEQLYSKEELKRVALRETLPPKEFPDLCVLFSDIVGFTSYSSRTDAAVVADMLDRLFDEFDAIARECRTTKIETIGDAFLAAAGLDDADGSDTDKASRVCEMAKRMIAAASRVPLNAAEPDGEKVRIRVGIHSGPAVGTLVGRTTPKFTLLGDTINMAARMEASSEPQKVAVTSSVAMRVDKQYRMHKRAPIEVKGKGLMVTYILGDKL